MAEHFPQPAHAPERFEAEPCGFIHWFLASHSFHFAKNSRLRHGGAVQQSTMHASRKEGTFN